MADNRISINPAVLANELEHTNEDMVILRKEIEDLKEWKRACTSWAMWWAGVCATVMSIAGLIQAYWITIKTWMVGLK